jgi:hypothetical protein
VAAGCAKPRARWRLYRVAAKPWRVGPGRHVVGEAVPCRGRTQTQSRVWLEVGDDPDMRVPPVSERERRERRGGAGGLAGPGEEKNGAYWAGPCREEREE